MSVQALEIPPRYYKNEQSQSAAVKFHDGRKWIFAHAFQTFWKIPSTCHCKSLAQMSCCIKIIDFTIRRSDCGSCQVYETIKFNDMYSLPIKSILPTAKYFSNHIQTQYMHTCIHTYAHLCILSVF